MTKATEIEIRDTISGLSRLVETNPLSNYNIFVIDQNLTHNSSLSIINSNVMRAGHTYDANVSSLIFDLYDASEKYNINGNGSVSQRYFNDSTEIGGKYYLSVGKVSGNFQSNLYFQAIDHLFNPNDLGFLNRNNSKELSFSSSYKTYKPFWRINRTWSSLDVTYSRLYKPDAFISFDMEGEFGASFNNFLAAGIWLNVFPINEVDYFEARTDGFYYNRPGGFRFGGFISSDYSKPFALDININILNRKEKGRYNTSINISPRFRFNDKFSLIYRLNYFALSNDVGLALTSDFDTKDIDGLPIFGQRDRQNIINVITANYIFNNKMDLSFRARHYWAKVDYKTFYSLGKNGSVSDIEYTGISSDDVSLHNNNYNAFTIDMVYTWFFLPGSQISIVWKNSIFSSNPNIGLNYLENSKILKDEPTLNSLSIKLLYYIDYGKVKSQLFKN